MKKMIVIVGISLLAVGCQSGANQTQPSVNPSASILPNVSPTIQPTLDPTVSPSVQVSGKPSAGTSAKPSAGTSAKPGASASASAKPGVQPSGQPSAQSSAKASVSPSSKTSASPIAGNTKNACGIKLDKEFVAKAAQGSLNGVPIKLGTSKQDLIKQLGQPEQTGFDSVEYLNYGDCYFFVSADGKIDVMDVRFTGNPTKVKELLGKPKDEGENPITAEHVLGYSAGSYFLSFQYPSKNDITGGFLRFKKP